MDSREALIALNLIENVGPVRARLLLEHFGDAPKILQASPSELRRVRNIGDETAAAIAGWEKTVDLAGELKRIQEFGCHVLIQSAAASTRVPAVRPRARAASLTATTTVGRSAGTPTTTATPGPSAARRPRMSSASFRMPSAATPSEPGARRAPPRPHRPRRGQGRPRSRAGGPSSAVPGPAARRAAGSRSWPPGPAVLPLAPSAARRAG